MRNADHISLIITRHNNKKRRIEQRENCCCCCCWDDWHRRPSSITGRAQEQQQCSTHSSINDWMNEWMKIHLQCSLIKQHLAAAAAIQVIFSYNIYLAPLLLPLPRGSTWVEVIHKKTVVVVVIVVILVYCCCWDVPYNIHTNGLYRRFSFIVCVCVCTVVSCEWWWWLSSCRLVGLSRRVLVIYMALALTLRDLR